MLRGYYKKTSHTVTIRHLILWVSPDLAELGCEGIRRQWKEAFSIADLGFRCEGKRYKPLSPTLLAIMLNIGSEVEKKLY